jgi:hypothetical protein
LLAHVVLESPRDVGDVFPLVHERGRHAREFETCGAHVFNQLAALVVGHRTIKLLIRVVVKGERRRNFFPQICPHAENPG